jgi:hypothetical protein
VAESRAEKRLRYHREYARRRRQEVIDHYGGACACCGEDTFEFLAIDHIDGDGQEHRARVGNGLKLVLWIIRNNFPDNLRILCSNCNQSLGYYRYCPHVHQGRLQPKGDVRQQEYHRSRRAQCLEHYGGECVCCGENRFEFLALDHKNNDGSEHRAKVGNQRMVQWIIKNDFPDIFQVSCHSCNSARGYYGRCPHTG